MNKHTHTHSHSPCSCSVCGELPVTSRVIDDGAVIWHCHDHLEADERRVFEELIEDGLAEPPRRTLH